MSLQQTSYPLTIAGRSPFDPVRVRLGGVGTLILGVVCLFGGTPGILVGIPLAALGIATLAMTYFGAVDWFELPSSRRYVVGAGALIGSTFVLGFLLLGMVVGFVFEMIGRDR